MQRNFNRHHSRSKLVRQKVRKRNLQELQAIAWICRLLASQMGLSYSLARSVAWRWQSQVNRLCLSSFRTKKASPSLLTKQQQVQRNQPVGIKIWHISSWAPHKRLVVLRVLNRFRFARLLKEKSIEAWRDHLVILMRSKTLEWRSRTPLWLPWTASFLNLIASMDLDLKACSAISC